MRVFDTLIWYFFIYAIIGYVIEVIYCSFGERRLVNRGFLHGPWLPIYGIGALLIIIATAPFIRSPLAVFVVTVIVTSALEYLGSVILEQVFSIKLWDYSTYPLNINGRVCAKNSALFGLLGLGVVYGLHPYIEQAVASSPPAVQSGGAVAIAIIIAEDTTISVVRLINFTKLLERYQAKKIEIEARLRELSHLRQNHALKQWLAKEKHELHEQLVMAAERLFLKFPSATARSSERRGLLQSLKDTIATRKKERDSDANQRTEEEL